MIQKTPKPAGGRRRPAGDGARAEAEQVFRQFAFNLAGTLAQPNSNRPERAPEKG